MIYVYRKGDLTLGQRNPALDGGNPSGAEDDDLRYLTGVVREKILRG